MTPLEPTDTRCSVIVLGIEVEGLKPIGLIFVGDLGVEVIELIGANVAVPVLPTVLLSDVVVVTFVPSLNTSCVVFEWLKLIYLKYYFFF